MHSTGASVIEAASKVPIFSLGSKHLPVLFFKIQFLQRSKSIPVFTYNTRSKCTRLNTGFETKI